MQVSDSKRQFDILIVQVAEVIFHARSEVINIALSMPDKSGDFLNVTLRTRALSMGLVRPHRGPLG